MTELLPAGVVSLLRTASEGLMPGTAVIWRRPFTSDGVGGQSGSIAVVSGGTVACRVVLTPMRPIDGVLGDRSEVHATWNVHMPVGTDVCPFDQIRVVSGGTFEVTEVNSNRSYEPDRRARCTEVR